MLIGFNYFLEVELQFIDNSFWDGSTGVKQWLSDAAVGVPFLWQPTSGATVYTAYLEDPLIPTPTWEPNKTRHIKIKIRNAGNTAFAEY